MRRKPPQSFPSTRTASPIGSKGSSLKRSPNPSASRAATSSSSRPATGHRRLSGARKPTCPTNTANYAAYLPDIVAGTALDAATSLEPAAVGTVTAALPNLSCFATPPDDDALETEREMLQLTAIQTAEGRTACLLYNFACPATIVGNTTAWTADFPGIASSALEEAGADAAIFIQGAAYDIRPFDWYGRQPRHIPTPAVNGQTPKPSPSC